MSTYVHKTGKGSIFVNENRTEENNQPHYTGSCKDPNGVDWQISAWKAKSQDGKKTYLSLNFQTPKPKVEQTAPSVGTPEDDLSIDF
jgi:hypothetical protein|tara:strand:- start:723 stop:983 length:261 start_codon:yes stop_codon:yes gene_type:complete